MHNCQNIYLSLLKLDVKSSVFIRELLKTSECNSTMYNLVNKYEDSLGKNIVNDIKNFDLNSIDEIKCDQVYNHYKYWTETTMIQQLSLISIYKYYFQ